MSSFISLFTSAIAFGTIIMFGALGEILTEKGGHLNLGVPGIMYIGAICGLISSFFYERGGGTSPFVGMLLSLIACFVGSALGGLIYAFLTITLRANQNVTGLSLTIFGGGVANFFGASVSTLSGGVGQVSVAQTSSAYCAKIPFLSGLGTFGKLFFSYGFMVYLAIIMAILMSRFLNKTRTGLNLRAVGESPATADAAGINVTLYKYLFTCIGGGICGLGGLYFTMVSGSGNWAADAMDGKGWLAVALVIFALWRPLRAVWGSILFGALMIMYMRVTVFPIPTEIYKILPYVVTLIVLVVLSIRQRRENQPPASLGNAYFREER